MDIRELKTKTEKVSVGLQIAPWSVGLGWLVLVIYFLQAFNLTSIIGNYFLISKAERDSAQAGSSLNLTLDKIQTTSAVLEPLKFVGITLIIVGISLFLIAILQTLKLRGEATRLALFARKAK